MDCRRWWRRSFAIRPSTYRLDGTHVCATQVHRFWKAKAQHASPTPHLSSASKIARAQQHRAIPCALKHQASARLSRLATSRVHLYLYSAAQNADNCCYTHQQALHKLKKSASALRHVPTGIAAPIIALVSGLYSAPSHLQPVHRLCELTSCGRYRCSSAPCAENRSCTD